MLGSKSLLEMCPFEIAAPYEMPEIKLIRAMILRAVLDFLNPRAAVNYKVKWSFRISRARKLRAARALKAEWLLSKLEVCAFCDKKKIRVAALKNALQLLEYAKFHIKTKDRVVSAREWLFSDLNQPFTFIWCLGHLSEEPLLTAKAIRQFLKNQKERVDCRRIWIKTA